MVRLKKWFNIGSKHNDYEPVLLDFTNRNLNQLEINELSKFDLDFNF